MYWKLTTLNRELRDLLVEISRQSRLEGTPCFFLRQDRWRMFGLLGLGGAALTPLLIWWCGSVSEPTWARLLLAAAAGLLGLWTVSLWLEFAKACRSELRPYLLVTPRELIKVGYDHQDLEGRKLRDAEDFKAVRTFSKRDPTTYTGTEYTFRFPMGRDLELGEKLALKAGKDPLLAPKFCFKLFAQAEIDALEAVLALAREPNSVNAVVELLPNDGGSETSPSMDPRTLYGWITNPFGILWVIIGTILLLVLLLGCFALIVLRILGKV